MLLYSLTIFLSAFLLFQVPPIIAKMILPWFGGSSAVWSTCMLFFQVVLLLGYLYAHWLHEKLVLLDPDHGSRHGSRSSRPSACWHRAAAGAAIPHVDRRLLQHVQHSAVGPD
jgi:hypothetical protein